MNTLWLVLGFVAAIALLIWMMSGKKKAQPADPQADARRDQSKHEDEVNLTVVRPLVEEYHRLARAAFEKMPPHARPGGSFPEPPAASWYLKRYDDGARNVLPGHEDPRLYGAKYFNLRVENRIGGLTCLNCNSHVKFELAKIEAALLEQSKIMRSTRRGAAVVFASDWSQGALCTHQGQVLCPKCSAAAEKQSLDAPTCPKCSHGLVGIDHITD